MEAQAQGNGNLNEQYSAMQNQAFVVLTQRCNTCHTTKNPRKLFTLENMGTFSKKIRRQVFVFKRMPRGKDRRAAMKPEEYEALRRWIESIPK